MANISLQHLDKVYDNNVQAVFDFNLEVKDGEFIVLVGNYVWKLRLMKAEKQLIEEGKKVSA